LVIFFSDLAIGDVADHRMLGIQTSQTIDGYLKLALCVFLLIANELREGFQE